MRLGEKGGTALRLDGEKVFSPGKMKNRADVEYGPMNTGSPGIERAKKVCRYGSAEQIAGSST